MFKLQYLMLNSKHYCLGFIEPICSGCSIQFNLGCTKQLLCCYRISTGNANARKKPLEVFSYWGAPKFVGSPQNCLVQNCLQFLPVFFLSSIFPYPIPILFLLPSSFFSSLSSSAIQLNLEVTTVAGWQQGLNKTRTIASPPLRFVSPPHLPL